MYKRKRSIGGRGASISHFILSKIVDSVTAALLRNAGSSLEGRLVIGYLYAGRYLEVYPKKIMQISQAIVNESVIS